MRYILLNTSIALLASTVLIQNVHAQDVEPQVEVKAEEKAEDAKKPQVANKDVFELGRITVHGGDGGEGGTSGQAVSQSIVTSEEVYKTNRNTLDDAVSIVPGVNTANTGSSRNERLIFVRGYDRFQVPLYIDGIRVYLPADNRLDYGRFLTPDLSEVQILKGYVSVLNGPGGMGGAINLVTRKPTKEFEAELRNGIDVGNTGNLAAYNGMASVGTRQENFYLQAAGSYRKSDGWFLSRDFEPTPVQDEGRREFSNVEDWRINLKAGYTPNATDEYVISYTRQAGDKGAPYSLNEPVRGRTPIPPGQKPQRDWRWPQWDVSSLSFYSHTEVGDASYVKTKAYYNTFDNLLSAFDDPTFSSQASARAFDSYYADNAYGFSVEGGTELIPMNSLKTALHYRRDNHTNWNHNSPTAKDDTNFIEPKQTNLEDTWSLALEDTFHATDTIDLVGGVSYDWNRLNKAEKFDSKTRTMGEYPLGGGNAVNWQAAAIYRPTATAEFHASVSSRTRFPTLFERYSTRFGDAIPNPDLNPERATNFELGWSDNVFDTARLGTTVFYSDVRDIIQSIDNGGLHQNQNIGDGHYYGFEVVGEWDVLPELTLGANYTYLKRQLVDPIRENLKPVGTPLHNAYLYANWQPYENFTVSPSLQLSSSRWSTDRLEDNFFETAGFGLANLDFQYDFSEQTSVNFGARNLFDKNYELTDGFPEAGRTFYFNTRVTF